MASINYVCIEGNYEDYSLVYSAIEGLDSDLIIHSDFESANLDANTYLVRTKKAASSLGVKFKSNTKTYTTIDGRPRTVYMLDDKVTLQHLAETISSAYNHSQGIVDEKARTPFTLVTDEDTLYELIGYIKQLKLCVFDFETTSITDLGVFDPDFKATCLSISFQHGYSWVIPLYHSQSDNDAGKFLKILQKEVLENVNIQKVAHNIWYEWMVCKHYGITLRGRLDCTMLMHHLIDETTRHSLKILVDTFIPEFSGYDSDVKDGDWVNLPLSVLAPYNAIDTDMTIRLHTLFEKLLREDMRVYTIYRNLTMAVFQSLCEASYNGMPIDEDYLVDAIDEVTLLIETRTKSLRDHPTVYRYESALREEMEQAELAKIAERLDKLKNTQSKTYIALSEKQMKIKAGSLMVYNGVNFGSWQNMADLLYTHPEGFNFIKISEGAGTSKQDLLDLNDTTGFVDELLVIRSLTKLKGTYLEGIHSRLDLEGKLHTTFKLHGTVSGRISSANPNLQNIPKLAKIKDDDLVRVVKMVKNSFVVPEGYYLVQADFSQAELRIIADLADETNMLSAYLNDEDLHASGAAKLLNLSLDEFYKLPEGEVKSHRTKSKARNFGLIYGMQPKGYTEYVKGWGLEISETEAASEIDVFFDLYPKLLDYHATQIAKGKKYGYVRTVYGRKRHVPDINSDDWKASKEERIAINSPVQGTGGEFMLFTIALLKDRLDPRTIFVNTVHDSALYFIPNDLLYSECEVIRETSENLPNRVFFGNDLNHLKMKMDFEKSSESWGKLTEFSLQV